MFRTALLQSNQSPMLRDALLALSSCNISRSNPESKYSLSVTCSGVHRPSLIHSTRSQLYYSKAIKSFALMSHQDYQNHLPITLMVILIFAYVESSTGNSKAFDCHARGLSVFLDDLHQATGDSFVKSLLTAWSQARLVIWWSRGYYRSAEVQIQLPLVPLPTILQSSFGLFEERRVLVLTIMCESYRLNTKAALKYWFPTQIMRDANSAQNDDSFETIHSLLYAEARKLDEWLSHLPSSELPIARHPTENGTSINLNTAIYFQSHDAALNYAYYVVARIMQSTDCLRRLPTRDPQLLGHEFFDAEPWIRLLLGIAKGSNMKTSIMRNTYTIGFCSLLLAAFLRCQDLSLSNLIEDWLQALEDLTPTEEGSFPIFQALSVIRAVKKQRVMGRDVFAVSQPVDNVGGTKFDCYCSQMIGSLFVHGKLRSTGDLFTEHVLVDGQRVRAR